MTTAGAGTRRRGADLLRDPVFVLGSPRSGTTFLARALGRIPGFAYCHEPIVTKALVGHVYRGVLPYRAARAVFRGVYRAWLFAHARNAVRLVEKTPRNCTIAPFLARAFPGSRFVHIVRDPRDAAVSHLEQPWLVANSDHLPPWHPHRIAWGSHARFWVEPDRRAEFARVEDARRIAWEWRRYNEMALDLGDTLGPTRYVRVHYERFKRDRAAQHAAIADLLGLEEPAARAALECALNAFRPDSIGQWRKDLGLDQCAQVSGEAVALMARLGYRDETYA